MNARFIRSIIGTLVCVVSVFVLNGCADVIGSHRTQVRDMPAKIEHKLSPGDTRQKVRALLGQPLIDSRRLGVEVYQLTGRDLDIILFAILPAPVPGTKVIVTVLVVYDHHDIVKNIASGLWENNISKPKLSEVWVNAGGFSFTNLSPHPFIPPDTLIGPPISRKEFTTEPITSGRCALIFLPNDCLNGKVSLDSSLFADFKYLGRDLGRGFGRGLGRGGLCFSPSHTKYDTFHKLFIRKEIAPGHHELSVHERILHGEFERTFVCRQGETHYAQLEVQNIIRNWWVDRLEGSLTINTTVPDRIAEVDELRPILWHRGLWYVPPN